MSVQTLYEIALKINNVMAKIQSELKCGICRSTFSNPVSATCGHVFCKDCLDVVFQRRRVVECPLCRQSINKRSCTSSEQHESMVQGYLQLGRNFLRDSQEQTLSIPKDVAFMDSQVPVGTKLSDSPMRDFRPTPQFVLPKARARRKQPLKIEVESKISKMEDIAEETECKENTPLHPFDTGVPNQQVRRKSSILARRCDGDTARYPQMKSAEVQCNFPDPTCFCRNLRRTIASFRERNPEHSAQCASDVNALFVLMPGLKDLLAENIPALCEVFTLQPLHSAPRAEAVKPAKDGAEGCSSKTIALDDFASDSDDEELNATQPPAVVKSEVVAEAAIVVDLNGNKEGLNDETDRPNSSCTRSSSDVVPQSDPPSEPGDADDEIMEITMQVPFDSVPREIDCYSSVDIDPKPSDQKVLVLSVSRINCLEDEEIVTDFIKMFPQVRYEEDITPSSTHLVMMNSQDRLCQKRSLRYVFAVARKCELVARSWLEDSIKAKELLPTTQYALAEETAEEEPGWIRARRTSEPLFNRMSFFLPRTFSHSQMLSHEKLKELITLCGGTCCDKPWELANYKKAYTIFMSQSKEWDVARRYEASMDGVPVLVVDWVLDSISEFRIKPIEPYKIQQKN